MKNNKMNGIITLFVVAIVLISLLYLDRVENYPKIIEVPIEKEVIVEKEVVIEKEVIVEKEVIKEVIKEIEVEQKRYNVTEDEREMLARLVYLEANITSLECQKMVASVVFNRYDAANGTSLSDIVYAKGQFTPAYRIPEVTPNERNYEAVDYVIKNGSILPSYVRFFRDDYHFNWEGYVGYTSIDGMYFGYLQKDKNN